MDKIYYVERAPKLKKGRIRKKLRIKVEIRKLKNPYIIVDKQEQKKDAPSFEIECTQEQEQDKTFLIDYIAGKQLHYIYAKSIVKKVAGNAKLLNSDACLKIVQEGYRHAIFEDIAQDIFIALLQLVNDHNCYIEDRHIVFNTYIVNEGEENEKEVSYYVELYRSLGRTLKAYTSTKQHRKKVTIDGKTCYIPISINNYDAIASTEDNAGNTLEYMISKANPLYIKSAVYIGADEDIHAFMSFVRSKVTDKRFKVISEVISSILVGYTIAETAEKHGYSIDKIKKVRQELKKLYKEAITAGVDINIAGKQERQENGIKTGISYNMESLGYTYIGEYRRNKAGKPYYYNTKRIMNGSADSINNTTAIQLETVSKSYNPGIGAMELISFEEANKGKSFEAKDNAFIPKAGKKVYSINKDKAQVEVYNYITQDGYIYSKELLRVYPIYKGATAEVKTFSNVDDALKTYKELEKACLNGNFKN